MVRLVQVEWVLEIILMEICLIDLKLKRNVNFIKYWMFILNVAKFEILLCIC